MSDTRTYFELEVELAVASLSVQPQLDTPLHVVSAVVVSLSLIIPILGLAKG